MMTIIRLHNLQKKNETTPPVLGWPCPSLFKKYCWHQIQNKFFFFLIFEVHDTKLFNILSLFSAEHISKRDSQIITDGFIGSTQRCNRGL